MGDIEKLQEAVSEQAVTTAVLVRAVSSIEALLTQQTNSIREIEKAMKNQEVLMEKLSNLDSRITDSVNRIHSRINTVENDVVTMKIEHKKSIDDLYRVQSAKCDAIEPMAQKGAMVHSGLVWSAKVLGSTVLLMMLAGFIWLIKVGATDKIGG